MKVSVCKARQAASWLRPRHQPSSVCQWRRGVVARAEGQDKKGGDSDFEALFARELQRRGLSSTDSVDDARLPQAATPPESSSSSSKPTADGTGPSVNPFKASSTRTRAPPPPKAPSAQPKEFEEGGSQREKSMALVTEGLEGLIPRASELLKLGGSLFLAFLPFMLAFSVLFTAVFLVWGDSFLHGGRRPTAPPRYIDPMELLSEPTVDPYIPFDRR